MTNRALSDSQPGLDPIGDAAPSQASSDGRPSSGSDAIERIVGSSDSYGLVLLLLLIDYVILSVGSAGTWTLIVSSFFIGVTATVTFHTSHVRGWPLRSVRIAAAGAFVAAIGASISGGTLAVGVVNGIQALLVLTCPLAIVSRIIHHQRVTAQTLLGAISIYVLIGLVFSFADLAVARLSGGSFFAQAGKHDSADFVYFSFITMTTVGYGDLTPGAGFPRTMAVFEALSGQVFLVVLVARLVALFSPTDRAARRRFLARRGSVRAAGGGENGDAESE